MTDVTHNEAADNSTEAPKITGMVPVFGIKSYAEAVAHYVDWLGFKLDWEWREAPGRPVIMSISRDGVSVMLNEADETANIGVARGAWLTLSVTGIYALADEWNAKRPNSVTVIDGPPYEFPEIHVIDPSGNRLVFGQQVSSQEEALRQERKPYMRDYIRRRLADDHECPTPKEVVKAIGGPIGIAIEILCEFPEYGQATRRDNA